MCICTGCTTSSSVLDAAKPCIVDVYHWVHADCCLVALSRLQVAWDWQLESTVVYRGAQYLDHFLATVPVQALSKFQMLAISALRTALKHSSKLAERERAKLPYKNWAEVTDGACTETEVRSTCTKLERILQQKHRDHPNAKQRLRYLWYRLYEAGVVRQEHVYVYMLASFLLHLSILDSSLSAVTPTLLATAALSLSLDVFRFSPWPAVLQEHSLYLQEDLQEPQDMLRKTQVGGGPELVTLLTCTSPVDSYRSNWSKATARLLSRVEICSSWGMHDEPDVC